MTDDCRSYWYSRFAFQRALAIVYLSAFIVAANQFVPLVGEHGLLPAPRFIDDIAFGDSPSLFFWFPTDRAFHLAAWLGVALSLLALTGYPERSRPGVAAAVWVALWVLYLSFVNVGQTFYAFGWESLLLEAGFLTIFAGANLSAPSALSIWMWRWLLFRIMLGAGLIKLRGDPCWRDLTCLDYYFETQPMPNPLSWYFHWLPSAVHHAGVVFNHVAELVVPFGYFAPQPIAAIAGMLTIVFQLTLIVSGNLSWLNWLTIVLAIPGDKSRPSHRHVCAGLHRRRPEHRPGSQHAVAESTDELLVQSAAPRQHIRSVRQHHSHAGRDRHRRNGRLAGDRADNLARI